MGIFDKSYASDVAGGAGDHAFPDPDLFQVETPCGQYQGVTNQVVMSGTPRFLCRAPGSSWLLQGGVAGPLISLVEISNLSKETPWLEGF